jgi:hypothetical protein
MLADGHSHAVIRDRLGCNRDYITRWKSRFLEGRLDALYPRH